jgi:ABC-type transporter Mla subunit MlaD
MSDTETKLVIDLQLRLAETLQALGFAGDPQAPALVHHLAELAARCRTFEQQSLPLFNQLSPQHRRSFAQLLLEIRADLDAIQDSITDAQPALQALLDHLLRQEAQANSNPAE